MLVNRVLTPWDEGKVTYGTRPETVIYDRTWLPPLNTGQYIFYQGNALNNNTAANLVQGWVNTPAENYGILLGYGGTGFGARTFDSREAPDKHPPVLRIEYTLPPIRVCLNQADPCQPAEGAGVYDKTTGQILTADPNGLIDSAAVKLGDELWGRLPVKDPYPQSRLFYTTGALAPVTASQFQQYGDFREMRLVVRADKPLLLYDLNMTAQWYLADNPSFMQTLQSNIVRASDYLYDFTDGQFALGTVTVRQSYEGWDDRRYQAAHQQCPASERHYRRHRPHRYGRHPTHRRRYLHARQHLYGLVLEPFWYTA